MDPVSIKPEMIIDVALGVKTQAQICAKYEITDLELLKLYTQEWFNKEVSAKRAKLESEGFNFTAKMKMLAEDMLLDAYHAAKLSDAVTPKLDVAKQLVKVAGLEPSPNAQQVAGAGFSININFNGGRETITLEANRAEDRKPVGADVWPSGSPPQELLDLSVPVRTINDDLTGEPEIGTGAVVRMFEGD